MAARGEVYAADLSNGGGGGGGVIEEIGVWLATKLGEKGIKSEFFIIFLKTRQSVDLYSVPTKCKPVYCDIV